MRISSFVSFAGFAAVLIAAFCPFAHFFFVHLSLFKVNEPYGLVVLLVAVMGILGCVFSNNNLTRLMAFINLGLVVLLFIAALFKISHYFSFMPFQWGSEALSHRIKFDWGWYFMCLGTILALVGAISFKKTTFIPADKID